MLGTGEFALPTFKSLYETEHAVVGLFTQPDRTGRGHHQHVNPLKELALQQGTEVFQPKNINQSAVLASLRDLQADLAVVAAYGQILSAEMLAIPRLGAINLHASLLPRHCGAAPIHYAILAGDKTTGVTIFQIEPQLDAGLILGAVTTDIEPEETTGMLHDRLAKMAVPLTQQVINQLEAGTSRGLSQDPALVTLAPKMVKALGDIDWHQPAAKVAQHIRAMQPWPTAYTFFCSPEQKPIRIIITAASLPVEWALPTTNENRSGDIFVVDQHHLCVQTSAGIIELLRLRPAGKREMTAEEFMNGHQITTESRFQSEKVALDK